MVCKKHNDRLQKYGDPCATPFRPNDEPTYEEIAARREHGDLNRNID
jgi:hypothetical protein